MAADVLADIRGIPKRISAIYCWSGIGLDRSNQPYDDANASWDDSAWKKLDFSPAQRLPFIVSRPLDRNLHPATGGQIIGTRGLNNYSNKAFPGMQFWILLKDNEPVAIVMQDDPNSLSPKLSQFLKLNAVYRKLYLLENRHVDLPILIFHPKDKQPLCEFTLLEQWEALIDSVKNPKGFGHLLPRISVNFLDIPAELAQTLKSSFASELEFFKSAALLLGFVCVESDTSVEALLNHALIGNPEFATLMLKMRCDLGADQANTLLINYKAILEKLNPEDIIYLVKKAKPNFMVEDLPEDLKLPAMPLQALPKPLRDALDDVVVGTWRDLNYNRYLRLKEFLAPVCTGFVNRTAALNHALTELLLADKLTAMELSKWLANPDELGQGRDYSLTFVYELLQSIFARHETRIKFLQGLEVSFHKVLCTLNKMERLDLIEVALSQSQDVEMETCSLVLESLIRAKLDPAEEGSGKYSRFIVTLLRRMSSFIKNKKVKPTWEQLIGELLARNECLDISQSDKLLVETTKSLLKLDTLSIDSTLKKVISYLKVYLWSFLPQPLFLNSSASHKTGSVPRFGNILEEEVICKGYQKAVSIITHNQTLSPLALAASLTQYTQPYLYARYGQGRLVRMPMHKGGVFFLQNDGSKLGGGNLRKMCVLTTVAPNVMAGTEGFAADRKRFLLANGGLNISEYQKYFNALWQMVMRAVTVPQQSKEPINLVLPLLGFDVLPAGCSEKDLRALLKVYVETLQQAIHESQQQVKIYFCLKNAYQQRDMFVLVANLLVKDSLVTLEVDPIDFMDCFDDIHYKTYVLLPELQQYPGPPPEDSLAARAEQAFDLSQYIDAANNSFLTFAKVDLDLSVDVGSNPAFEIFDPFSMQPNTKKHAVPIDASIIKALVIVEKEHDMDPELFLVSPPLSPERTRSRAGSADAAVGWTTPLDAAKAHSTGLPVDPEGTAMSYVTPYIGSFPLAVHVNTGNSESSDSSSESLSLPHISLILIEHSNTLGKQKRAAMVEAIRGIAPHLSMSDVIIIYKSLQKYQSTLQKQGSLDFSRTKQLSSSWSTIIGILQVRLIEIVNLLLQADCLQNPANKVAADYLFSHLGKIQELLAESVKKSFEADMPTAKFVIGADALFALYQDTKSSVPSFEYACDDGIGGKVNKAIKLTPYFNDEGRWVQLLFPGQFNGMAFMQDCAQNVAKASSADTEENDIGKTTSEFAYCSEFVSVSGNSSSLFAIRMKAKEYNLLREKYKSTSEQELPEAKEVFVAPTFISS